MVWWARPTNSSLPLRPENRPPKGHLGAGDLCHGTPHARAEEGTGKILAEFRVRGRNQTDDVLHAVGRIVFPHGYVDAPAGEKRLQGCRNARARDHNFVDLEAPVLDVLGQSLLHLIDSDRAVAVGQNRKGILRVAVEGGAQLIQGLRLAPRSAEVVENRAEGINRLLHPRGEPSPAQRGSANGVYIGRTADLRQSVRRYLNAPDEHVVRHRRDERAASQRSATPPRRRKWTN